MVTSPELGLVFELLEQRRDALTGTLYADWHRRLPKMLRSDDQEQAFPELEYLTSPEATLAATAESEFLRHKKIGANGADIAISPSDIYNMTQLSTRTDRVLPNGVCLLPPLKTCDKGNACLSCGHFATDATHLDELLDQRTKTLTLIDVRRDQYRQRTGRELTDENVWIHERRREVASLDAIIERLRRDPAATDGDNSVGGAGTANRLPVMQVKTRGSHQSVLRKADPDNPR